MNKESKIKDLEEARLDDERRIDELKAMLARANKKIARLERERSILEAATKARKAGLTAKEAARGVESIAKLRVGYLTNKGFPSIFKLAKDYLTRNPEHTMLKILITLMLTMMARLRLATNPLQTKISATLAGLRATKSVKKGGKVKTQKPKQAPKMSKKEQAQWKQEWPKQYSALYHQWVETWLISARARDRLLFRIIRRRASVAILFSFGFSA